MTLLLMQILLTLPHLQSIWDFPLFLSQSKEKRIQRAQEAKEEEEGEGEDVRDKCSWWVSPCLNH